MRGMSGEGREEVKEYGESVCAKNPSQSCCCLTDLDSKKLRCFIGYFEVVSDFYTNYIIPAARVY